MNKVFFLLIFLLLISACTSSKSQKNRIDRLTNESNIVLKENFENGLSNLLLYEKANNSAFIVMNDFHNSSNKMLKVTLEQDDIVNNGNRAEFKVIVNEKVGDEMVYQVEFMIDNQYIDSEKFQSIFQLHDKPDFTNGETWSTYQKDPVAPPLIIHYVNNNLSVMLNTNDVNDFENIHINKNQWYKLTVNVKYGYDDGFVEVFLDDKSITKGKVYYPTIYNDSVNYVKVGLYRDNNISSRGVVYFDNFNIYRVNGSSD